MRQIDRFGTLMWNLLEILVMTLVIFLVVAIILPAEALVWALAEYAVSLSVAVLINRVWLPIKYYADK